MTQEVRDLIEKFTKSEDLSLIPSIIIGLQEEENVSAKLTYKNCFKQLRNIAAHEPASLVAPFKDKRNKYNQKILIQCQDYTGNDNLVVLDIAQFVLWMNEMTIKKGDVSYLTFGIVLLDIMMPYQHPNKCGRTLSLIPGSLFDKFTQFNQFVTSSMLMPQYTSIEDPYVMNLYKTNVTVYWRMAIPSILDFIRFILQSGYVELTMPALTMLHEIGLIRK